jgi:hypothetical protein
VKAAVYPENDSENRRQDHSQTGGTVNHKRGRPKNQRAGCLMCKNWKMNGAGKYSKEYERPADRRRRLGCEQDLAQTRALREIVRG